MKESKRYKELKKKVDPEKKYSIDEAFSLLPGLRGSDKFDETVDVAVRLGIDAKQSDQLVRGAISLPHGTGKTSRVIVFAKGDKAKEAQEAGADVVGAEELVQKILSDNWLDFDSAVATPDMMGLVGRVARLLGPRGLMPNPKVGTVTLDVAKVVRELKGGRIEFRTDKAGIVHAPIGKISFGSEKLKENAKALLEFLVKLKPSAAKGVYMKSLSVSTTMGTGVRVDVNEALSVGEK